MEAGIVFVQDLAVILLAATFGGWLARRIGLSVVVGYLFAGLLVGTPQVTFLEVSDPVRVQVLSQLGLVFLMFSIGLGIRLSDLKALGLGPVVATVLTALMMLFLGQFVGGLVGLNSLQTLFFAAMLMVSSSAIIGKVLEETGQLHERPGQLALGQTLLEDFVAVVMLTILGTVAAYDQPGSGGLGAVMASLGQLGAFVLLFVVSGLLLLPRLVRRIAKESSDELIIILIAGVLFGLALLTVRAGYSLALGAFLTGVLVAEVPRSRMLERSFVGMRDVFTAVFFMAVGMAIDLRQAPDALGLIVVGTVLALVGRFVVSSLAWMVAGENDRTALQTALFVTPIGEFSFIIAGLGVTTGVLPPRFQIAAVGIAFLTSVLGPLGMRHAPTISDRLALSQFKGFRQGFETYRELWRTVGRRGGSHLLWRILRPRLWQVGRDVVWITATLLFARPLFDYLEGYWEIREGPVFWFYAFAPLFWLGIFLLSLAPLVALFRNLDALCMILVDYLGMQVVRLQKLSKVFLGLLRAVTFGLVLVWLANLLPWALLGLWPLLMICVLAVGAMILSWRRLVRWHRRFETELQEVLESAAASSASSSNPEWDAARQDWSLHLQEMTLPDDFAGAGSSIGQLRLRERYGVSVVGVERQGWPLSQPGPNTHLFPGDRLFMTGKDAQIAEARTALSEEKASFDLGHRLTRAILKSARVTEQCPLRGRNFAQLNWPRLHGVQVVAVRREQKEIPNPGAHWQLQSGDELLLCGTEEHLRTVFKALEPAEEGTEG